MSTVLRSCPSLSDVGPMVGAFRVLGARDVRLVAEGFWMKPSGVVLDMYNAMDPVVVGVFRKWATVVVDGETVRVQPCRDRNPRFRGSVVVTGYIG